MPTQILPQPPRVGIFGRCPKCKAWFALRYRRTEQSKMRVPIDYYRCRLCQDEIGFARALPPGAV